MTPVTNVATTPKSTTTCQFLFSSSFFIEPCCIFKFMPQIGQSITSELHHCCWIHTACLYQPASLCYPGNCITICFASLHRARNHRNAHHWLSYPRTPAAQPLQPCAAPSCLLMQPPWPPEQPQRPPAAPPHPPTQPPSPAHLRHRRRQAWVRVRGERRDRKEVSCTLGPSVQLI